ncbi:MAG: hypothetical protein ACE5GA_02785 [Candidatus Zixiibacteriota bacterium]
MGLKSVIVSSRLGWLKRQCSSAEFVFPDAISASKNVLICLPQGLRELTLVKPFLPEFVDIFAPAEMYLLATPGSHVANIFPRKGYRILAPGFAQCDWTGLPKASYLETVRQNRIDLIIDLNLGDNPFIASALLTLNECVRIGVGDHLGKPYYNLEIRTAYLRDERNIYRSFIDMIARIRNPLDRDLVGQTRLSGF